MRYFIPEWDDRVDPGYNFVDDKHSAAHMEKKKLENDANMWEIFDEKSIPFDGILVSLMNILPNNAKYTNIIESGGLHNYLRLPKRYPILADCGAWGYIKNEEPIFSATEVFEHYANLMVQEAVTVDHLVLSSIKEKGKTIPVDVDKRIEITFRNGLEGHKYWEDNHANDFDLLVSVQGLEPNDYIDMLDRYLVHGIANFAFGGLAKKSTRLVVEIIDALLAYIDKQKPDINKIHFFGLGRQTLFSKFEEVEERGIVVSFDSASWLRQAWLGGKYFLVEKDNLQEYTALRVPSRNSFKGKKKLTESADLNTLDRLQSRTMRLLRVYEEDLTHLNDALDALNEYDKWVLHELKKAYRVNYSQEVEKRIAILENRYRRLEVKYTEMLKERPWSKCDCPICKKHGIEVAIFRGNDRNRRRGFHNTYIMYHKVMRNPETWGKVRRVRKKHRFMEDVEELVNLEGNVLVITGCSKTKISYNETTRVRAKELYTGRLFKSVKLYSKVKGFPYVIISAKYGLIYPDAVIGGYEQVLSSVKDVERIKPDVNEKLSEILSDYDTILIIAGKKYREVLDDVWDERFVYVKAGGYSLLKKKIDEATTRVSVPSLKFYV